ncbi:hypothetical protein CsSME_00035170 [Camellia sinensis var. sinensis]
MVGGCVREGTSSKVYCEGFNWRLVGYGHNLWIDKVLEFPIFTFTYSTTHSTSPISTSPHTPLHLTHYHLHYTYYHILSLLSPTPLHTPLHLSPLHHTLHFT